MYKLTIVWLLAAALLNAQRPASKTKAPPISASQSVFGRLLTPADVEKVTNSKGVRLIPKGAETGVVGDLNFARGDGTALLMVSLGGRDLYAQWRKQDGFFHAAVRGIGDEAFDGPAVQNPYVLFFRKGDHAVSLSSFLGEDAKPLVRQEQLREMAKIIASRQ